MKNRIKQTGIMFLGIIALALAAGCNQKKPAEQSANAVANAAETETDNPIADAQISNFNGTWVSNESGSYREFQLLNGNYIYEGSWNGDPILEKGTYSVSNGSFIKTPTHQNIGSGTELYTKTEIEEMYKKSGETFSQRLLDESFNPINYTYSINGNTLTLTLYTGDVITYTLGEPVMRTNPAMTAYDYSKILNGDLSDFAGDWENSFGDKARLMPNGIFSPVEFIDSYRRAYGFAISEEDTYHYAVGTYYWSVAADEGQDPVVFFYPVGVEVHGLINDTFGIIPTSTIRVRISAFERDMPTDAGSIYYLVTPAASANENNSVFPPKINLFQYSKSDDPRLYGFPGARIWGWSNNGKAAYSIERAIEGRGGQRIDFVILDSVSDETVFELSMDSEDHNGSENEALYQFYVSAIENALRAHNIVRQPLSFLPFPFTANNTAYNASLIDIKRKDDEWGVFDTVITEYAVSVSADNKSKVIGKFSLVNSITGYSITGNVYVCGYFLSPFENRALIVVAEEHWGHEGTELTYRFAGCHLGVGFN